MGMDTNVHAKKLLEQSSEETMFDPDDIDISNPRFDNVLVCKRK